MKLKYFFAALFTVLIYTINFAQSPQIYTSSGTWVCPQGVTSVQVEAWGGGAGARNGGAGKGEVTGGGGGGAYARRNSITVTPGTSYPFTIGAGGTAGLAGGDTTATINGVVITAAGGSTGAATAATTAVAGGAGGSVVASIGDVLFAGGNGGSGWGDSTGAGAGAGGGGGSAATSTVNGNNGGNATGTSSPGLGGATVGTFGGAGGNGGNNLNGITANISHGGGGGGGGDRKLGGLGFRGGMRFTYTCPALLSNAGTNQNLAACSTTTTLAANTPTNATGLWTVFSGTGTITTPTSPTSGVTGIAAGTPLVLRWTVTNGTCGSTFTDVTINSPLGAGCWNYCPPTHTVSCAQTITNVTFNTINNTSGCANTDGMSFTNYAIPGTPTTSVLIGSTYNLSITTNASSIVSAWIDFNNNGTFEASEWIQVFTTGTTGAVNFLIPGTSTPGLTRMRIRSRGAGNPNTSSDACTSFGGGETESYLINLVTPVACVAPTAQPTVLILTPASGTINGSFTAASPISDNYLVVMNTTGTAPTPANGTSYTIGSTALGGTNVVVDNDANTTFSATLLSGNTTYYFFIYSFNNLCSGGPLYITATPLTGSATTLAPTYCTPTGNLSCTSSDFISNVTYNTLNNTTACNTSGYTNFSKTGTQTTTVIKGSSYTFSLSVGSGTGTHGAGVWIDFNNNGSFSDAGEFFLVSNAINPSTTTNISIAIPAGAVSGDIRMRVRYAYLITVVSGSNMSCSMAGTYGETEDYTITVVPAVACTTPISQPTALILTPSGTTINGSFTAASPVPNNYLVVRNTTGIAPSPIPANGTSYTIGSTALGGTNVVVDNDGNTTFSTIPLVGNTTYYFFIYSYNSLCTGGPLYNTASALTGNVTTTVAFCTPSSTLGVYPISNVTFAGINNNSTSTTDYYENFTGITGNVTGGSTYNISVTATATSVSSNTFYQYVFFDWNNNGDFSDSGETYLIGTYSTLTGTLNINVQIPVTASGTIRMRVGNSFNGILSPCATSGYFQMEDYTLNITPAPVCTTPTSQPTVLALTPSGTSISAAFTAASPTVQSYLVVMNTTNVAPTGLISNGTTYTTGSSIGVGNTVIDTDSDTSFIAAGLNNSTTYYFFIYSMNNLCTGGPLYNTAAVVLIGNTTTTTTVPTYCTAVTVNPNNTNKYINRVAFIGTLNDTNNTSTFSTGTPGYQDFTGTAKSIQAQGEGINLIVESTGGRARLIAWIDWNKDGVFATSEIVYGPPTAGISSTFGFIIPSGTVPGDYRIRVRTFNSFYDDGNAANGNPDEYFGYDYNACETFNTGTYNGFPTTRYGEAEDYLFTVIQRCDANIASVTDGQVCSSGTVTLSATGTTGTTHYRWYADLTGGAQLAGSPTTGSWITPSISTTTTYYVTAFNGSCESLVRKPVVANVNPIPTLSFTPSNPEVCGENSVVALTALGDKQRTDLLFERFESGGLGSFTSANNDANSATVTNDTKWTNRSSTFIPLGISWKPAISSGLSPNSFALATSDSRTRPPVPVENSLVSGTLNSTGYLNLTMTMKFYYSRYYPDNTNNTLEYVRIQISQNGGTTWTTLGTDFVADTGIGTQFVDLSYNLNTYINQANLKIRIVHNSDASSTGWLPDGVAIDDVHIFGDIPLNTAFNWTGASLPDAFTNAICTIPYTAGTPIVTVYVRPTLAQLASGSYTFTATALLSNGCTASQPITITNKSKLYVGAGSDWNTGANWSPAGVPTANDCVVITDGRTALISPAGYQAFAKNTTVKSSGVLNMNPLTYLTNTEWVNVLAGGIFNLENSASLIQINNVANTGSINMKRSAAGGSLDYIYWSTPVGGFSLNSIAPLSLRRYSWSPTTATGYASNFGNWAVASGGMTTGRGYIVLNSGGVTNFVGNPNNGNITVPITRGTYTGAAYVGPTTTLVTSDDDNWNLLGNPYPSALSADAFLAANSANLNGFVKIWTHNTLPVSAVDPFYQDFLLNYTTADYLTYNASGGTQFGFDGRIAAGQGFFVLMNNANTVSENVVFNNTMRSNAHRNDQFYRTGNGIERNRIWLDIISPTATSTTTLIGYITDATDNIDNLYDAIAQGVKTNFEIYSIAESQELIIQGRSLPFNQNDEVTLGVSIPQNGIYTIAINNVDGLFLDTTQKIYLEDKQLGIFHDLRTAPYTFTGVVGRDENRFVLLYNSSRLSQEDVTLTNNLMVVSNENVTIHSSIENINSIEVHDLLGKIVKTYNNIDAKEFMLNNLQKNNTTLLLKVKLSNGSIVGKKIIF